VIAMLSCLLLIQGKSCWLKLYYLNQIHSSPPFCELSNFRKIVGKAEAKFLKLRVLWTLISGAGRPSRLQCVAPKLWPYIYCNLYFLLLFYLIANSETEYNFSFVIRWNFIHEIPASKSVWLLAKGMVAVYPVHPTKPVKHRYPICSVSVG
jgi:hypothetical protein